MKLLVHASNICLIFLEILSGSVIVATALHLLSYYYFISFNCY